MPEKTITNSPYGSKMAHTITQHMSEIAKGTTEREIALVKELKNSDDEHIRTHAEEIAHVRLTLG